MAELESGIMQNQSSSPRFVVTSGQVGFVLAYGVFILLWLYSEYLERLHKRANGTSVRGGSSDEEAVAAGEGDALKGGTGTGEITLFSSGFFKCLRLDPETLREQRLILRAAVEFGSIMVWYFIADRTTIVGQGSKNYSRDIMGFIFLTLTLVAFATSMHQTKAPQLLNRLQTEEWKGWMQVLFLLYHYFEAKEIYNAIRVFIAGYVWMTGFGNFSYYYKFKDFTFGRFAQMMWRLNFLVVVTCIVLQNSYMLYYICPMHTIFTVMVYAALGIGSRFNTSTAGILVKFAACFAAVYLLWDVKSIFYAVWGPFTWLMGYSDPRKPTSDLLHEWHFRSSLDRYVWIHGMICAYMHPWAEGCLARIEAMTVKSRTAVRTAIVAVTLVVLAVWYEHVYKLPKLEYNKLHPYTSWIPITVWIVLRNMTPQMRLWSLGLYGWLGCITLETYIGQFHTWLLTGMPDGQPKLLLAFFPPEYPLLNFAGSTAVYVYVSYRLFQLTLVFKNVVVPHGDRATTTEVKQLTRNFILVAVSVALLWALGYVCLLALGMAHVIQPLSPAVPAT